MEALFSMVLVLLGVIILLVYALLFIHERKNHGQLTGTDDEEEGDDECQKNIH